MYRDFDDDGRDRYVRVSKRRESAADMAKRLEAEGIELQPAAAHGKGIATSFWGRAWCRALEDWQDYESRLPQGRSLLKNGGVIDLKLSENLAEARVAADQLYSVRIVFNAVDPEALAELKKQCAGKLTGLVDLIQGNLSDEVMQKICDPVYGLFPKCGELKTICNCIDDAVMCRHAAAALYAIAPRLDEHPELFFTLRGIHPGDFFDAAAVVAEAGKNGDAGLSAGELADTFGIDVDLD